MIVEVQTRKSVRRKSDIVRIDDIYEENRKFTIDNKRIWVAGSNGMVGKSIIRLLKQRKM